MKTLVPSVVGSICGFLPLLYADPPVVRNPLDFLVRSSTLIVDADITDTDSIVDMEPFGVANFGLHIRCRKAIVGKLPAKNIEVNIPLRVGPGDERPPYLRKGHHCIFFLRERDSNPLHFGGVDTFFSALPYSAALSEDIELLNKYHG